jgi:demethylmenaquinone methyltransferase/2-methoxy-6-polyprenyl-1,4-benzoquinol methylase
MHDESPPGPPERNPDATLMGTAKRRYVMGMFSRIAAHYDLMNTLMTFGQDERWRQVVVRAAGPVAGQWTLDVGTGTGKIARDLARGGARSVGLDLTLGMMQQGQAELAMDPQALPVRFVCGDALALPWPDNTFACVTTGFTMRNVTDIPAAFAEMARVVRPGGRVVCLEVATPANPLFRFGNYVYTRRLVPLLGRLVAGDADAYSYLPTSMGKFPAPPRLAAIMTGAGLRPVRYRLLMLGSVGVHVGIKPKQS